MLVVCSLYGAFLSALVTREYQDRSCGLLNAVVLFVSGKKTSFHF